MPEKRFCPPDAAAMDALLSRHDGDVTGTVLALAWLGGLTRAEIHALTWDRVDLNAGLLRLPDRDVPLEEPLAGILARRRKKTERVSPFLAVSDRLRTHMAPESLNRLARDALTGAGMPSVRLLDLRYDYVRRQAGALGWPGALRAAGLTAAACRGLPGFPENLSEPDGAAEGLDLKLWRVMQSDRDTPGGLALWLASQLGLRAEEMAGLTWDAADLDAGTLTTAAGPKRLSPGLLRALREARDRRRPGDDPHILLSPRDRRPIRPAWLAALAQKSLVRGGITDKTLLDLRRDESREEQDRLLLAAAEGGLTRRRAAELLHIGGGAAYGRLAALRDSGLLRFVGGRYYPAESVAAPERMRELVLDFLADNGPAYVQDLAELLGISKRAAAKLLKEMVEDGQLRLRPSRQYETL